MLQLVDCVCHGSDITRQLILSDLFGAGVITIKQGVRLPIYLLIAAVLLLTNKKLILLYKKYFSILPQNLPYYLAIQFSPKLK